MPTEKGTEIAVRLAGLAGVIGGPPEVIRLVVMMYARALRKVEDLLYERGSDLFYETARL